MISRTTIKRAAVAGALSLATTLTCVSPAGAATNLKGIEPFNTDKLLMTICNGRTDWPTYWWINIQTGEVMEDGSHGIRGGAIPYPWERFEGYCTYGQSSSWTWTGAEKQVSNTLVNCSSGSQLSQNLQLNGSTTSTTTNSVTGSVGIEWNVIEKVLSVDAGASYTRSWSYAKSSGWSTTTGITVPPKRVGWMAVRPVMRTVRSNPVFHVTRYSWGAPGTHEQVDSYSWRGRGYNEITSYGAYYDAVGNVLNPDGTPNGQYVARDRAVKSTDRC